MDLSNLKENQNKLFEYLKKMGIQKNVCMA